MKLHLETHSVGDPEGPAGLQIDMDRCPFDESFPKAAVTVTSTDGETWTVIVLVAELVDMLRALERKA
jgi:hypothetical protein